MAIETLESLGDLFAEAPPSVRLMIAGAPTAEDERYVIEQLAQSNAAGGVQNGEGGAVEIVSETIEDIAAQHVARFKAIGDGTNEVPFGTLYVSHDDERHLLLEREFLKGVMELPGTKVSAKALCAVDNDNYSAQRIPLIGYNVGERTGVILEARMYASDSYDSNRGVFATHYEARPLRVGEAAELFI